MATNNTVHVNECGLPLNAIEWLETHHYSKSAEREQMIRDLVRADVADRSRQS